MSKTKKKYVPVTKNKMLDRLVSRLARRYKKASRKSLLIQLSRVPGLLESYAANQQFHSLLLTNSNKNQHIDHIIPVSLFFGSNLSEMIRHSGYIASIDSRVNLRLLNRSGNIARRNRLTVSEIKALFGKRELRVIYNQCKNSALKKKLGLPIALPVSSFDFKNWCRNYTSPKKQSHKFDEWRSHGSIIILE